MPSLRLTPRGHLLITAGEKTFQPPTRYRTLERAFARGSGFGLLELGASEVGSTLPEDAAYWRDFAAKFVTTICTQPDIDGSTHSLPPPSTADLETFVAAAPPMDGVEYVTPAILEALWAEMADAFRSQLAESGLSVQALLQRKNPTWHLVGRVHFNLAENRRDEEAPFAFLATYTIQLSTSARAQHLPLGQALTEYAGAANKSRLLSLLLPVQRAAAECAWLKTMVEAGEIYHPLRWTAGEAYQLLIDVPRLEAAGVIVRVPTNRLSAQPHNPYAPLRTLVRPYILRRLKTDKAVIADLPDKTELKAF